MRPRLDAIDIKILATLQREGRITKLALAERVNLSPTPCWERLKRLEQAGIITGYGAQVALEKLAEHVVVFVTAELENHRAEDFERFEAAIEAEPEIARCWALGGGYDYAFQVITHNINSYQKLIDRLLDRKVGLARYYTYVVTKQVKDSDGPPLDELLGAGRKAGS